MFKLCLPSMLYFISSLIFTILSYSYFKIVITSSIIIDIVLLVFFTWLLNYFCTKNFKYVSWFIFIVFMIINFAILFFIKTYNIRTLSDLQKLEQE